MALESYMADGSTSEASGIIGSGDASDVSRRRGYAESVGADSDDLLDELRGTEARADADARTLEELQAEAAETEAQISRSRDETEARLTDRPGGCARRRRGSGRGAHPSPLPGMRRAPGERSDGARQGSRSPSTSQTRTSATSLVSSVRSRRGWARIRRIDFGPTRRLA